MKYVQIRNDGVVEVREDTCKELPINAIELSDEDFAKLESGEYRYSDGKILKASVKSLTA